MELSQNFIYDVKKYVRILVLYVRWIVFQPILIILLFVSLNSWAFEQNASFWPGINYQNYLTKDRKFAYLLHSQLRFINKGQPLETGLVEGSVGYAFNDMQRLWVGYYWSINQPYHDSYDENRTWQQFYWKLMDNKTDILASRTRIEEIQFSNQDQKLYVLRQMVAHEWVKMYFGSINPLVYDETFFRLNHPSYDTNTFLNQNRLFLGINIYSADSTSFWKIGYMNQYLRATPSRGNAMNHILTVMYTIGVPKISLPVDS